MRCVIRYDIKIQNQLIELPSKFKDQFLEWGNLQKI
jgi:hypothetical protein